MKRITIIACALFLMVAHAAFAQEFKLAKSNGKLVITGISNLIVEGYDGKDIIFSATGTKKEKTNDPRAACLSALGNSGFDNTGIGISVTEKENLAIVSPIEKRLSLTVKLPTGVALSIKTTGFAQRDSSVIKLSNIKAEIDASTQYEHFTLNNVSGPVSLKTLHGNIEGKLTQSFKGPISLVSVYGFIDVTVPENAKADMSISTQQGALYAAKDLKLVVDENPVKEIHALGALAINSKTAEQNLKVITVDGNSLTTTNVPKAKGTGTTTTTTTETFTATPSVVIAGHPVAPSEKPVAPRKKTTIVGDATYSYVTSPSFSASSWGTTVNGKLNGGGEKIILKSTYGKIYLRK